MDWNLGLVEQIYKTLKLFRENFKGGMEEKELCDC